MTEFVDTLNKLGLSAYTARFIAEGFDTWETLCYITESDLYVSGHRLIWYRIAG